MDLSPVEVVKGQDTRRVCIASVEYTSPQQSDTELLNTLIRSCRLADALALCNERLLSAPDDIATLIWTKDASVVKLAEGRPADALTLLASVHRIAERLTGQIRGKYENGMGRTQALHGNSYDALRHYDLSIYHHTDPVLIAQGLNNKGRLLTAEGAPADALSLFEQGLKTAGRVTLVRAEILESLACALGDLGRDAEARRVALESVELLEGTGNVLALEENRATLEKLLRKMTA